jgi:iron complex transport system substrate-binding protein
MKKLVTGLAFSICIFSTISHANDRIISVGGAITETVFALDQAEALVGSDTTSYYPMAAAKLPKVGYQRALSSEGVLSLKPSLILASEDSGPPTVIKQLKAAGVQIATFKSAKTIEDVKTNILQVGHVLKTNAAAHRLVAKLEASLDALNEIKSQQSVKPTVLFLMNHGGGSPMVAGQQTAADGIITLAGATNVVTDFTRYKPLTPESAVKYAPDFILISSQTLEQVGGVNKLLELPGLSMTPAGKSKRIVAMDALLLLGFGPRTVDAALELNSKIFVQ